MMINTAGKMCRSQPDRGTKNRARGWEKQRSSRLPLLWLAGWLFAQVPACLAATYCVAPGGSDSNPGTTNLPWRTIQKAAGTLSAGDTATILPGIYSERPRLTRSGRPGAPITFEAQPGTVSQGFIVTADYITIKGFEIWNTNYVRNSTLLSSGIHLKGAYVAIVSNYIHDCALVGIELYGPRGVTNTHHCTLAYNRLYHNELVGCDVNGFNHLVVSNEVWRSCQCHTNLTQVEDHAADNPAHLPCPFYPAVPSLDADGMRFFGSGHRFIGNYIHDIPLGPPGINPAIDDYNDTPHIDCFQTWDDWSHLAATNILFERNFLDNYSVGRDSKGRTQTTRGFQLGPGASDITIRNNIIRACSGVNATGCSNLIVVNNTFAGTRVIGEDWLSDGVSFGRVTNAMIANNVFLDMARFSVGQASPGSNLVSRHNIEWRRDGRPTPLPWPAYRFPQAAADWHVNPRLVAPDAQPKGDYRLQAGSPAIHAGANLGGLVPTDFDGNPRPTNQNYTIGAFEYAASPTPTLGAP